SSLGFRRAKNRPPTRMSGHACHTPTVTWALPLTFTFCATTAVTLRLAFPPLSDTRADAGAYMTPPRVKLARDPPVIFRLLWFGGGLPGHGSNVGFDPGQRHWNTRML